MTMLKCNECGPVIKAKYAPVNKMVNDAKEFESSIVIDNRGNPLKGSVVKGNATSVGIVENPLIYKSGANMTHIHTHPFDAPLSGSDFLVTENRVGLREISAITPEGKVYSARILKHDGLGQAAKDADWTIREEVVALIIDEKITQPEGAAMMLARQGEVTEKLVELGFIEARTYDLDEYYLILNKLACGERLRDWLKGSGNSPARWNNGEGVAADAERFGGYTIVKVDPGLKEAYQKRRYLRKRPDETGSLWTEALTLDEQKRVQTWKRYGTALRWLNARDYVDVAIEKTPGRLPCKFNQKYDDGLVVRFEIVRFIPKGYRGVEEKPV